MHHALADGVAVVRINVSAMSERRDDPHRHPPWATVPEHTGGPKEPVLERKPPIAISDVKVRAPGLLRALTRTAVAQIKRRNTGFVAPYSAPRCMLNGHLTPARRYATQSYEMGAHQGRCARRGGTINDVILSLCSTAIRRYLLELKALPKKSIIGSVPVALDRKPEETLGSVVGLITTTLATTVADPKDRLAAIVDSCRQAKANLFAMPKMENRHL